MRADRHFYEKDKGKKKTEIGDNLVELKQPVEVKGLETGRMHSGFIVLFFTANML